MAAGNSSIKRKFLVFSIVLFVVISAIGSMAFVFSMRQMALESASHELVQSLEIERIKLEASVNGEIALALKMADSPVIKRHFLDPADSDLRAIAFEEIIAYQQAFASRTVFWCSDTDKVFHFDVDNYYALDPNNPDNYWYRMTLYETERFNFNINYNEEIQKTMLFINAPVFETKRAPRTPIGLVGTAIDLTEFLNAIYRDYRGKAALYFFNSLGEITGAKDANLVAGKVALDKHLADTGAEILARARGLRPGESSAFASSESEVSVGTVPVLGWNIALILPLTLRDYISSGMTALFTAIMAVIAVLFIVFYLFITGMLKPLNTMITVLNQISGDWDLTRRLEVRQRDETGKLAEFFNVTFGKIGELLKGIKGKAFTLSGTTEELHHTMTETSQAIGKINSNIDDMRGKILAQADEIHAATVSMERIISGLGQLNSHIEVQAGSVAQSSSAIEEMLANISSITNTLVKNTANINSLAQTSGIGRADLQKVSQDIQEIARESEGLLEINSVMQTIASQTNLLSMNAAIEAAHAGESGMGFAVVADEIRKLAENSGKQSKIISVVLKKIKTSIDAITKSTSVVMERFSDIEREVEAVSSQEALIRSAMEEQGTGSRSILEAITQLNSTTDQVQSAASDMAIASKEVLTQSANLKKISGDVAEEMDTMSDSANLITDAVTRVQDISQESQHNLDALSSEIARFKVE
jgi:methyl-accepting chemotaxis protein